MKHMNEKIQIIIVILFEKEKKNMLDHIHNGEFIEKLFQHFFFLVLIYFVLKCYMYRDECTYECFITSGQKNSYTCLFLSHLMKLFEF